MNHLGFSEWWTLKKTASYYVMHITIAAIVAYAVTRSWQAAIALSLIEPTVQAVAYYFHEKAWQRRAPTEGSGPFRVERPWAAAERLRRRMSKRA